VNRLGSDKNVAPSPSSRRENESANAARRVESRLDPKWSSPLPAATDAAGLLPADLATERRRVTNRQPATAPVAIGPRRVRRAHMADGVARRARSATRGRTAGRRDAAGRRGSAGRGLAAGTRRTPAAAVATAANDSDGRRRAGYHEHLKKPVDLHGEPHNTFPSCLSGTTARLHASPSERAALIENRTMGSENRTVAKRCPCCGARGMSTFSAGFRRMTTGS